MKNTAAALADLVGHAVPTELLDVLASYPADLAKFAERAGLAPYECPLYPDLDTVLAANEEVRAEDIWTEEGPWPAGHLDIGAELSGDRFALGLHESPPRVFRLNHELGRFVCVANSLGEYVDGLTRFARGEVRSLSLALPPLGER